MGNVAKALLIIAVVGGGAAPAEGAGPLKFYGITPCRLADTHGPAGQTGGPVLQHAEIRSFPIWGDSANPCGIPPHATAVAVNVVVFSPTSVGHLTLFPYNTSVPFASTINYNAGEPALANATVISLTDGSGVQLSIQAVLTGIGQTVHVALDATGYFR